MPLGPYRTVAAWVVVGTVVAAPHLGAQQERPDPGATLHAGRSAAYPAWWRPAAPPRASSFRPVPGLALPSRFGRRPDLAWQSGPAEQPSAATVTLLSLGLPGTGQHLLGQRRKWVYGALEVVGWALLIERRAAAGRYRDRYRDFAWENARLQDAERVDGDFEYYETLTKWSRSGSFDSDPAASGVQPEPDPGTFNGSIWALALQIYVAGGGPPPQPGDPAYQGALAYYEERAYGNPLLWDWGASDGRRQLARLIEDSDDRFRQATTVLGAVLANHLIAGVDAYVSARGLPEAPRLRVEPVAARTGGRWNVVWSMETR